MSNCTCGSLSVGSHLHSSYCEIVADRSRDQHDFLADEARKTTNGRFYYVCTGENDSHYAYAQFREKLRDGWSSCMEAGDLYVVRFKNGSEVFFARAGSSHEDKLRGLTLDGVLVQRAGYTDELIRQTLRPLVVTKQGWLKEVDPATGKII
jgi:hypothetical protein